MIRGVCVVVLWGVIVFEGVVSSFMLVMLCEFGLLVFVDFLFCKVVCVGVGWVEIVSFGLG